MMVVRVCSRGDDCKWAIVHPEQDNARVFVPPSCVRHGVREALQGVDLDVDPPLVRRQNARDLDSQIACSIHSLA